MRRRPLRSARSIDALFLSIRASSGKGHRHAAWMPPVAIARSRGLAPLDSGSALLLERLVQALCQLPECVRRLTQVFILFLQLFDFFLTFLQHV
jgi:hypothetical protein